MSKYQIDYDTAIEELGKAKMEGNIVVFMGAGVSKFVEPSYPIWDDVTKKLKSELPDCKKNNPPDVAQEYLNRFGKDRLAKSVSSLFPNCFPNTKFYDELLKCRPKYLITTNWDNMLQNAIGEELSMYDTIADDKELMDSKLFNKYIKMHGDFQHNFVLTKSSYASYSENYPLIENFVKSILYTNAVIFIGYSLIDKDSRQILNWIEKSAPVAPQFYCAIADNHYKESSASEFNRCKIKTFKVPDFTDLFKRLNNFNIQLQQKDPIPAFAGLLKLLCKDQAVLLSSLRSFITNCSFEYVDESHTYLRLFTNELTGDYNRSRRNFFDEFINAMIAINTNQNSKYNNYLQVIYDVLNKTGVLGIVHNDSAKIFLPVKSNT